MVSQEFLDGRRAELAAAIKAKRRQLGRAVLDAMSLVPGAGVEQYRRELADLESQKLEHDAAAEAWAAMDSEGRDILHSVHQTGHRNSRQRAGAPSRK
jgi:hypothetical protein